MSNNNNSAATTVSDLLAIIAQKELGLETLETRNSDSLDFHDLNVASIKAALEAAYLLGGQVGAALGE